MSQFSRIHVVLAMKKYGVVPVFYNKDIDICKGVIKACYDGGGKVFEFTNRGDYAHEIFSQLTKWVSKKMPEMILGVGSVVDAPTAALYIQCGANFIVSPLLNEQMAKVCNRRKVLWIPGCGSISEISIAEELGAEVVKIFPASQVGGPAFIKAVKGPCPWTNIMPTGGVTPEQENLKGWFDAGAYCVGMGSNLMKRNESGEFDLRGISQEVKACVEFVQSLSR